MSNTFYLLHKILPVSYINRLKHPVCKYFFLYFLNRSRAPLLLSLWVAVTTADINYYTSTIFLKKKKTLSLFRGDACLDF